MESVKRFQYRFHSTREKRRLLGKTRHTRAWVPASQRTVIVKYFTKGGQDLVAFKVHL